MLGGNLVIFKGVHLSIPESLLSIALTQDIDNRPMGIGSLWALGSKWAVDESRFIANAY